MPFDMTPRRRFASVADAQAFWGQPSAREGRFTHCEWSGEWRDRPYGCGNAAVVVMAAYDALLASYHPLCAKHAEAARRVALP